MNRRTLLLTSLATLGAIGTSTLLRNQSSHLNSKSTKKSATDLDTNDNRPKRIISLFPAVTSAIFAMGEEAQLFGRARTVIFPLPQNNSPILELH